MKRGKLVKWVVLFVFFVASTFAGTIIGICAPLPEEQEAWNQIQPEPACGTEVSELALQSARELSVPQTCRDILEMKIEDGLLTGITIGTSQSFTSVAEVKDLFSSSGTDTADVVNAEGLACALDAPIRTGDKVLVSQNNGQILEGTVLIPGDVLGIGIINISQLVRLADAVNQTESLSGIYLKAGDFTGSGDITVTDLIYEARLLVDPTSDPLQPSQPDVPSGTEEARLCAEATSQIIARVNALRAQHGLGPLPINEILSNGAQIRVDEIAETDLFSHTRPNGENFQTAHAWPEGWVARGENLGYLRSIEGLTGTQIGDALFDFLSESASHEAIMLNQKYNMLGVAVAFGPDGAAYAVQWFAG